MYAAERQREIARRARQEGRVEVAALADDFGVAGETIRRDLSVLERRGVLHRVHGGALPAEKMSVEAPVATRETEHTDEKARIAKAALEELPPAGTVLLDAGTTTMQLAKALPEDCRLTVVTNSLPIGLQLASHPNLTLLTVGGRVRGTTQAQVDRWALRSLADIRVDVAFVATNGVSTERGLTTPDLAEASVKEAMIASAGRVVLLADHTKVGADHFAQFGSLDDVDLLVTDADLDDRAAHELERAGLAVVRA